MTPLPYTGPRLGGSTIGAACGIDPWCSPIRLWLELTGRLEREETEAMRWGKRLQPVIFAALADDDYPVWEASAVYDDVERPWLVGHPDDRHAILAANPEATPGKRVRETKEIRDARRELAGLLAAEKARKGRIEALRAVLCDHMGDADELVSAHDVVVATWRQVTSKRLDVTLFRKERPELFDLFAAETTTRRLVLT